MNKLLLFTSTLLLTLGTSTQANDSIGKYKTRLYFNQKLEPRSQIIHGAGQSKDAFINYKKALHQCTQPLIYMNYSGLKAMGVKGYFNTLNDSLPTTKNQYLIPQLGLSMTSDGFPEKHYEQDVAAGMYDGKIHELAQAIQTYNQPMYIRVGYEFNGHWNGYEPETYKQAFIRIATIFKQYKLDKLALVWCFAPDGRDKNYMNYYPGDEYVDWWAIDIFKLSQTMDSSTIEFLEDAKTHQKPVMIGESTPRRVGVLEGETSWNLWFKPYFRLISHYPQIKAICYINWNWADYGPWADWGDARLEKNEYVREHFQEQMKSSRYLHSKSKKQIYRKLNIK